MRNCRQRDWRAVVSVPPDRRRAVALLGGDGRRIAKLGRLGDGGGTGANGSIGSGRRGTVSTHRDGHCGGGRCGAGRGGSSHRVGAAVARDEELGRLRVDDIDIGTVYGVTSKFICQ